MPASEYADYLEFAFRVAVAAGAAILPHFRRSIDVEDKGGKADYDPVTEADRLAEAFIRGAIEQAYPTHGIFGEEHGRTQGTSPLTWVIDPIDGTRSFILGQLHWGTLIALHDGERAVVGVMHQPFVGETFAGAVGAVPQWRRGDERRALKTRPCARIEDAIVATTDPRHFDVADKSRVYRSVTDGARLIRYGGDCYCYTLLAMGMVDIVIETGLEPYDVQALIPIVETAGGRMTDWQGGSADGGGNVLACGDVALHAQLLRRIAAA
ncbi:MAG: histidinol-phosphatase [Betaproteobacteria bacterium]|nr:MAG: histidinol-phosphatase [Betaproteobacteria bacterium]